ncbi:MAG TPA: DUF2652 domain-containing protein, partial [Candidatus Acidoferrum sp.]|nr:DUF2652 domain-containing protein [Candidatus Acidoferrum sp.]
LQTVFAAFDAAKQRLAAVNVCTCNACDKLAQLELKFILHAGPVLHFKVRKNIELGGLPVILLHRLCKNSVPVRRYILWTPTLAGRMQALQPVQHYTEHYDELGATAVQAHLLQQPAPIAAAQASWFDKLQDYWRKELPWWGLMLKGVRGKAAAFSDKRLQ